MILRLALNDERITLKLHSHGQLLAARIDILPFNSFSIALVSFFIDLKRKKGKMSILVAKSCPYECSFRYIITKTVAKGEPAGPRFFWKCFCLLVNGATSGLSQRRQASPYICYIFLLILVEKTKGFTVNLMLFFLFLSFAFLQKFVVPGGPCLSEPQWSKKKINKK